MTHPIKQIRLSELLSEWLSIPAEEDVYISGISEFSGDCVADDLFLAMKTINHIECAIAAGAVAILADQTLTNEAKKLDLSVPVFTLPDLAASSRQIIERFYQQAEMPIQTIAITGTDGKTSVAHMLAQALGHNGKTCGLIGTLGYGYLDQLHPANHTTPTVAQLARELQQLTDTGCEVVAMEASSHGIEQGRLENTRIDVAVLTNITRDHLDYHKTMENYIAAKAALFFSSQAHTVILNIDDEIGKEWYQRLPTELAVVTYSLVNSDADLYTKSINYHAAGTTVTISIRGQEYKIELALFGQFNVLNMLAVAATLISLNFSDQEVVAGLAQLDAVPGRMQFIPNQKMISVVIDYAHTPAALSSVLDALRKHCHGRLICVFGCGGERDTGKRSTMGEIAARYADDVVITSDNPRHEAAQDIIDEIAKGCLENAHVVQIIDRYAAIAFALKQARMHDTVLIAGKGHEKVQIIGDQRIAFDDAHVVQQVMSEAACG